MDKIRLRGAFSPNPRIEPLLDGTMQIPGVEITWQTGRTGELHLSHLTENRFDIFEFSLSNFLITRDQPAERERLRWIALPIFLSKALMWLDLYVPVDSGITSLADLRGKRVGVPDYHMTAAIWMRIVLRELFGIRPQDIEWFNGRPAEVSHGQDVGGTLAAGIVLKRARRPGELGERLRRGELDAAYGGTGAAVDQTGDLRPLFGPGEAGRVIEEFRRKTGITPVNHLLIIQQDLAVRHPELAMQLYGAFEMAKLEAYARARRFAAGYLLFAGDTFARQAAAFGADPFPSGLAANRIMLEKFARASLDEGLLSSLPEIDDLFLPRNPVILIPGGADDITLTFIKSYAVSRHTFHPTKTLRFTSKKKAGHYQYDKIQTYIYCFNVFYSYGRVAHLSPLRQGLCGVP